jgi:glucokinase
MCGERVRVESSDGAAVMGIDIGGTKIEVALAAPDGEILGQARLETRAQEGPGPALERVAGMVVALHRRHGADRRIVALGAVCPGVVQPDRILLAPNLPGWEETDLAAQLRSATGVATVVVTNDVRAGALAEVRLGALRGCRSGLYVNLGTGIAAALVVDGRVAEGAHHAAGEIGYVRPSGALGAWAVTGYPHLESAVGGNALAERAANVLGESLSTAQLFGRADPVSAHLVHQALGALGTALVNLAVFADPDRVVIGGGFTASADVVLPVLDAYLRTGVPFPPEVVVGDFDRDASLHGAIALALDTLGPPDGGPLLDLCTEGATR